MTPDQEKKLDEMKSLCISMNGKFDVQDEKFKRHFQAIIDTRKEAKDQADRIISLEKDRDKATGALAILTFLGLGSLGTAIASLFRNI